MKEAKKHHYMRWVEVMIKEEDKIDDCYSGGEQAGGGEEKGRRGQFQEPVAASLGASAIMLTVNLDQYFSLHFLSCNVTLSPDD